MREVVREIACRMTAREVLARVGGSGHALHTIVERRPPVKLFVNLVVRIRCSCGSQFVVPCTDEHMDGLRNVRQVPS